MQNAEITPAIGEILHGRGDRMAITLLPKPSNNDTFTPMKHPHILAATLCLLAASGTQPLTAQTEDDVTATITNPSFETDGLSGWTNIGMASQTNNSTTSQGWEKDGTTYAEKWTSASDGGHLSDASIMQQLSGLRPGTYLLRAEAHAVNQSGTPEECKGVSLVAGYFSTPVSKGGTYEVKTVVARSGQLTIGFSAESTDANWMAVDHFRLVRTGEDAADYRLYLQHALDAAHTDSEEAAKVHHYTNAAAFTAAFAAADKATTANEVLDAIDAVEQARADWAAIRASYDEMFAALARFERAVSESAYGGKAALTQTAAGIRSRLESTADERPSFAEMKQTIADAMNELYAYQRLNAAVYNARLLLSSSQYEGHAAFAQSTETAAAALKSATGEAVLNQAAKALAEAQEAYLAKRPEQWVTIRNGALWKDTEGNSVQAHGAGFLLVGDTWYMIGENRIASWNPDVNMYSSKDLQTWKFERTIIKNGVTHPDLGSGRFIERPKLMYNARTGKYVVWCHWEQSNYGASEAAVFECDSVNGSYRYVWSGRPLDVKSRDCNVFVDDDGTAYFISTTSENTNLGLFRLSDDYTEAVAHTVLQPGQRREAPAIVKVDGRYYMLSSACSGWDPNQCKLTTSESLTEGWTSLQGLGNGIAYDTQAASILTIKGTKATTYLYVGDRWQDPDLPQSKTIIFPISFGNGECQFTYHQQFDINFVTGEWRETPQANTSRISKAGWSIKAVSSEETDSENGAAANAIDDDPSTIWHTRYSGTAGTAPHSVTVDMGEEHTVAGFLAMPRTDNGSTNGLVREFLLEMSTDAKEWTLVSGSSWMPYGGEVYFSPVRARYFRFTSLSGTYASVAEFEMLESAPDIAADPITPYVKVGDGDWAQRTDVTVTRGSNVTFGPSVASGTLGTWAFTGPNRLHRSTTRENTVTRATAKDAGTYVSTFLNAYGMTSSQAFTLTLGTTDGIGEAVAPTGSTELFALDGRRIDARPQHGCYIERTLRDDGMVSVVKRIH